MESVVRKLRQSRLLQVRLRQGRAGTREGGHALITALFVLLLVSLAVALVAASLQTALRGVRHELRSLRLMALTDASLSEAVARLADDGGFTGQPEHPFGGGTLRSEVIQIGAERWRVRAWAHYRGLDRGVQVTVRRTVSGYAISGWRRNDTSSLREGPVAGPPLTGPRGTAGRTPTADR